MKNLGYEVQRMNMPLCAHSLFRYLDGVLI